MVFVTVLFSAVIVLLLSIWTSFKRTKHNFSFAVSRGVLAPHPHCVKHLAAAIATTIVRALRSLHYLVEWAAPKSTEHPCRRFLFLWVIPKRAEFAIRPGSR